MTLAESAGPVIGKAERQQLTAASTPMLLQYLYSCVDSAPNKYKAVMKLLHCSRSAASRLLSKKTPYRFGMRMTWALRICNAVGKPLSSVAPKRVTRDCMEALTGWTSATTFSEAMQLATDCAMSICMIAFNAFGLRGWYTLRYDSGWPTSVDISLAKCPELAVYGDKYAPHKIIVTMEQGGDGKRRMFAGRYHKPEGRIDKQPLTYNLIDRYITKIYALTKNHAAGLERETNAPPAQSR